MRRQRQDIITNKAFIFADRTGLIWVLKWPGPFQIRFFIHTSLPKKAVK